jgi:hypothetical protein
MPVSSLCLSLLPFLISSFCFLACTFQFLISSWRLARPRRLRLGDPKPFGNVIVNYRLAGEADA